MEQTTVQVEVEQTPLSHVLYCWLCPLLWVHCAPIVPRKIRMQYKQHLTEYINVRELVECAV